MSSSIKFCMKAALIFKFWVIFDKVMSVYSQKIAKNPLFGEKSSFWCHFRYVPKISLGLVDFLDNPFLEN